MHILGVHLPAASAIDEERLALGRSAADRRERGAFFTPRALVERTLDAVAPYVPSGKKVTIIDPACGAGAFLAAAATRFGTARLIGLEVDAQSAAKCRARVPQAQVTVADALRSDIGAAVDGNDFELWVGNPPYNGTSPLLKDPAAWESIRRWLPAKLSRGQSLRDDYAFFMLLAARRLVGRPGALAFITSASLLDAYLYAPLREHLTKQLRLREVVELGAGAFTGTRVSTCITVWSSPGPTRLVKHGTASFTPCPPEWRLRPVGSEAARLHDEWSRDGEPLTKVVPVSYAGLKTRFDELLVDDVRERLLKRLNELVQCRERGLAKFASRWEIPQRCEAKLTALWQRVRGASIEPKRVQPFLPYRGPETMGAPRWCYVDRRFIPRGDHRLQGEWNPHAVRLKLAFNVRESPLAARVIDAAGCVTAYRHSRFAPAMVPERLILGDFDARKLRARERLVPNLSAHWASRVEVPQAFERIASFVMGDEVQQIWAPAFATTRVLPIPSWVLTSGSRTQPAQLKLGL